MIRVNIHINKIYSNIYLHARLCQYESPFQTSIRKCSFQTTGGFTARPEALRNYLIPPANFRDSVLNLDKTISCHTISNELLIITQ